MCHSRLTVDTQAQSFLLAVSSLVPFFPQSFASPVGKAFVYFHCKVWSQTHLNLSTSGKSNRQKDSFLWPGEGVSELGKANQYSVHDRWAHCTPVVYQEGRTRHVGGRLSVFSAMRFPRGRWLPEGRFFRSELDQKTCCGLSPRVIEEQAQLGGWEHRPGAGWGSPHREALIRPHLPGARSPKPAGGWPALPEPNLAAGTAATSPPGRGLPSTLGRQGTF